MVHESQCDVAPKITPRTRAIVAIHSYGNMCELDDLLTLAEDHGIAVIEDAAEAFGSRLNGAAGSKGLINTFSFHATKTITTGEGGLVTTNDNDLAARIRLYRSHGLRRERHYWHEIPGNNFRLTNLQAALGVAQLEQFDRIVTERRRVYDHYRTRLRDIPGVTLQAMTPRASQLIWAIALKLDRFALPPGARRTHG